MTASPSSSSTWPASPRVVSSANLRLFMTAAGPTTIVNQAFLAVSDSWAVAAGSHVDIDVTPQVVSALSGDKLVSVLVDAPANYCSDG